ncbi:hypothetical protein [Photobacterium andalusiense]|uniref:Pentapeptide repeats (8 copies) n=1 Tax=Photobacterium andalusiense TaxID=2204296 RepID=A0A1Y6MFT2_9GAMM|nr:hypothetical protein [Photobacterium andalusiense]SMY35394.1 hypothetical protein PAND9192_02067 [Photobacterium andalusiense]
MELWRQGKDAWNEWVEKNPVADVSFISVDFSKKTQRTALPQVSFSGFKFPDGNVDFSYAQFGKGDVDFSNTQFGKGDVVFFDTKFGEGDVSFRGAVFGEGDISFFKAEFGNGFIHFTHTKFGNGNVTFTHTKFGNGNVTFGDAEFGNGNVTFGGAEFGEGNISFCLKTFGDGAVNFVRTQFGKGHVSFSGTEFGEGNVDFSKTKFDEGDVDFSKTKFGEGNVSFVATEFGKGAVSFSRAEFGEGVVDFDGTEFGRHANFSLLNIHYKTERIGFRYAVFNGSLEFSTQSEISVIPDFIGTKTTNHTSFSGLKYKLKRDGWGIFSKAVNENDGESLCRLKEIADSNKEYVTALRFHADEMRAKRWQKERMGTAASLLDMWFDFFSRYGQSIWRPIVGLFLTIVTSLLYTVGFFFPLFTPSSYAQWFTNMGNISYQTWVYGFEIALSRAIPFLGGKRIDTKTSEITELLPVHFDIVSAGFSLCAFAFMFLIGLGLRNRFRL